MGAAGTNATDYVMVSYICVGEQSISYMSLGQPVAVGLAQSLV